jgi:hypothetical protein
MIILVSGREIAATRHMLYGTTAACGEGIRNASGGKWLSLLRLLGCFFRRRFTCFGENLELTSARLPLLRLWVSLSFLAISFGGR